MARLLPLRGDLEPEARELAEFLREAFERLGIHVRDYAKATNWSPGTLSKFLSGDRIPRQDFIDRLLADAYPQHSSEEAEAARRRGRDLRSQALRVRNSREAEVDRLEQALSDANQVELVVPECPAEGCGVQGQVTSDLAKSGLTSGMRLVLRTMRVAALAGRRRQLSECARGGFPLAAA